MLRNLWPTVILALSLSREAEAQRIRLPKVKDVVKTVIAPAIAPAQTTIRILRGDDPRKAVMGPWKAPSRVIEQSAAAFQQAQDAFNRLPDRAIGQSLGPEWVRAYRTLNASQRVQHELASTSGRYLDSCMQGRCSVNQIVAGPLAAALRDAYKV